MVNKRLFQNTNDNLVWSYDLIKWGLHCNNLIHADKPPLKRVVRKSTTIFKETVSQADSGGITLHVDNKQTVEKKGKNIITTWGEFISVWGGSNPVRGGSIPVRRDSNRAWWDSNRILLLFRLRGLHGAPIWSHAHGTVAIPLKDQYTLQWLA